MAFRKLSLLLAGAATMVEAHYKFVRVAHNGVWQSPTRFFRNMTEPYEERSTPNTNNNMRAIIDPTYPSDYPESVRCGRDHMAHAADTDILTVQAGDHLEFAHVRFGPSEWEKWVQWDNCPNERGSCTLPASNGVMDFNHPGPFLAHLSRAPDDQALTAYDGSGDWLKIYSLGYKLNDDGSVNWIPYNYNGLPPRLAFNIPEQTPAGEYLLRLDLLWPALYNPQYGSNGTNAQLYPSCVQLKIESPSTTALPKGIKIPEDIMGEGVPGMSTSLSMYRLESADEGYVYPMGFLWNGVELIEDKPQL